MKHNLKDIEYCVAIRTLGLAGNKFQQELISLINQTIPPKKILVYIAEGYEIPKETIGVEKYIYVPKGMIAQRALPYNEVDTEFILLLDDDVLLEPNAVEKLYKGLVEYDGDCIAADTFKNQDMSLISKIRAFITNMAFPRKDDNWAFKVQHNASFSYNNHPSKLVYKSQSAAGPASLWKTDVFRSIKFHDELWLDQMGFAYGEDLLLFYKSYINGYNLLVHYDSGITHLDAQSSRKIYNQNKTKLQKRAQAWLLLWFRACYSPCNTMLSKSIVIFSFLCKWIWGGIIHLLYSISILDYQPIIYYFKGTMIGYKMIKSPIFKTIPSFRINNGIAQ